MGDGIELEGYTNGICCSCGYGGEAETICMDRDDKIHCVHWWEGPDKEDEYDGF